MFKPFELMDFANAADAFELPNFPEKLPWTVTNQNDRHNLNSQKRSDYDKNICRYIVRQIIRSFVSDEFEKDVLQICGNNKKLYKDARKFFIN